ncbi:MAG TPA: pyruvate, phosphate dikinase [Candidatus Limnocylindrales bacterium]|nr:pyruvate, phosphate dikinase [Candidatus Limnocylindrales bacterium]
MTRVFAYDHRHELDAEGVTRLLGGKAANLAVMAVELGLPVPPAFTISTEACREYLAGGWPTGLDEEVRAAMGELESVVGRRFGGRTDPLLVSVRSGAPRSMPGMMDTILNLGLTDETEEGLAAASGDAAFAADCHARFRATYADVVGEPAPDEPWAQLRGAIEAVFRSWNSDRAVAYRRREGIPDDLGTGVTVQAMVFGNRGADSGTGVLFTRNPATGEHAPYGDVLFDAQGEDVVAGTHRTATLGDLHARMPTVAAELRRYADVLERHFRDCCDIEFTIERGRLWMLQTRVGKRTPQAALRMAVEMAEDPAFPLTREEAVRRVAPLLAHPPTVETDRGVAGPPLAVGLGASPGIAAGEIALTADAAVEAAAHGADVILVRPETSPDDVHGMGASRGILTATGGFASHAAVVARGWGIPAVVGAAAVAFVEEGVRIGGRVLAPGEVITIDGATGEVFEGASAGVRRPVPEVAVLLGWARGLGIRVVPDATDGPAAEPSASTADPRAPVDAPPGAPPSPAGPTHDPDADDALRALAVKGYATPEQLGHALRVPAGIATSLLAACVDAGLAEPGAGAFRPTDAGRARYAALTAADAAGWGPANALAALDAFLDLDHRMKAIVTAWQVRDVDGAQVANDHGDAAYDRAVLDRLAALHRDVDAWLRTLDGGPARLAWYGERLGAAAAEAAAGNGKFVASPRVDSYHGAWFELHEDLIRLAGRTREDEVAAGRA